ncbi:DUF2849 domain-containing protein [Rhodobaculum claviforme]|uniref:DUF2849 domain-containing protein n=1 Tax=Rhodobaculum claviforme TaxID=1549854 RepID=A0A934TI97_9RHOB|nr:DUF2849 domain-containing protein [Rhodobaculum claviforme]MBK5926184.1 hypothetical protein [Rhodobaculum claviforme]
MTPQIVRALDPLDGDEIYLAENGGWTRDPQAAARALTGPEAAALLAVAGMQPDAAEDPDLVPAPALRRRAAVSRPSAAGAWPAAAVAAR